MKTDDIYRTILVRMWGDQKFRNLSPLPPSGQSLWIYLLTGPFSNRIGFFRAGEMALAEELGWDLKAFRKAFREVLTEGLVQASPEDRLIFIPNFTKINRPFSPNVVTSWSTEWKIIPECSLKEEAWETIKYNLHGTLGESFVKAFIKACPKPSGKALSKPSLKACRIQEQEQEQEQEKTLARPPKKNPANPAQRYAPEFDLFWSEYPRKTGKGAAYKAWKKINPPLAACLQSLEWQKRSDQWTRDRGQYIPHPATWINQSRWEDEKPAHDKSWRDMSPEELEAFLGGTRHEPV
jgi:hypothetical protein